MNKRTNGADFDVVIVGGGIVGSTLAAALARNGIGAAVIESAPPRPYSGGPYAERVSALNVASQRILSALGAWPHVAKRRVSPFRQMHVWDEGSHGSIHFSAADIGEPYLGHIVENDLVVDALHAALRQSDSVEVLQPLRVEAMSFSADAVRVRTSTAGVITAKLLVAADGARSRVRRTAAIDVARRSYRQRAIVANVKTELPHEETAWQRFLTTGPVALLPLADGNCSLVWSCDTERAKALAALDKRAFAEALGAALEHRLGAVELIGERRAFALLKLHAQSYIGRRCALIGDAAHVTHPLAGLGANLGVADAASLAQVLQEAFAKGRADAGSHRVLRAYERWRRGENALVLTLMDAFKSGFGSRSRPLAALRGLALGTADALAPLNHLCIRRAMGLEGDLPLIARGGR